MEMRPKYRGRTEEMVHRAPLNDSQSLGGDSGITLAHDLGGPNPKVEHVHPQERDVVEEVRHELLHSSKRLSAQQQFQLVSKDDAIMDADTQTLWSASLFDDSGVEESSTLHDDSTATRDLSDSQDDVIVRKKYKDDAIIRKKYKDDTVDTRTVETTVLSFDDRSELSSSCSFFANEWRDQGIFCCGTEIGEDITHVADQSNSIVETAATGLLHRSILESADSFFSDEQAESLQKTLSEVSEEFDEAGNRVVDLTSMINMKNLCIRQAAVQEDHVEEDVDTVPSEVSFRVRVLTKLSSSKHPTTWKKKHLRPLSRRETPWQHPKKSMFRKFKGRFRKGKSSTTAQ